MQGLSGVHADTAKHLVFDAGALYFNIDVEALEDTLGEDPVTEALAEAVRVGATRGGSTFNVGRTLREIEADGLLGPVKGLVRRQEVRPVLTVNMLEISKSNLVKAIAGATATTAGDYAKITGGPITEDAYIGNIALLTTYSGSAKPIIVVLFNVLVHESFDLSFADEDEPVATVPFVAHFDPADGEPDEDKVWRIYHPGEDVAP
jgi:hypothetical protein